MLETAGMSAVFACYNDTIKDIIFTGSLAELPQNERMCRLLGQLHGLRFHLPKHSTFATAIGAAGYAKFEGEPEGSFFEKMKRNR
ncbi:hypothetical protein P261_00457 [Lachnospiraceae bacterium TWA4]|nr:hypothetical protein P261_00457 [Lachnospiraceae bacterium TWA4]